jgi:rare lipoprotein A
MSRTVIALTIVVIAGEAGTGGAAQGRQEKTRTASDVVASATSRPSSATAAAAQRPRAQVGLASYYARLFDGRLTASGTTFDNDAMVAAHPSLPFGTMLRVVNIRNQREVDVEVVDRGPAKGPRSDGVIIDLSRAAAEALGFLRAGRTRVRVEIIPAEPEARSGNSEVERRSKK